MSQLQNRLSKVQNEFEGVKPHLGRLKDLESENRVLQGYVEKQPELKKDMASFERQKKNAYDYGKAMAIQKTKWVETNDERRRSIEQTHKFENGVKYCNSSIADLKHRQEQLSGSTEHLNALQRQLEQTTGLFKGKDRKILQEQIDRENAILKGHTDSLKADYSVEPAEIDRGAELLDNKKQDLSCQKFSQVEHTDQQEAIMGKVVKDYKYLRAMSETQELGFREISTRHDAMANLPDHAERNFKIGRGDRAEILERMEQQHPNNAVRCRNIFERQAQQEQAKVIEKTISRTISQGGMER